MKKLSWKPVLNGDTYCSPACGAGCTYDAYLDAMRKANALADLCGKGWKPKVSENLGWHYKADKGVASMREDRGRKKRYYTVFFNSKAGQIVVTGRSPHEVLLALYEEARDHMRILMRDINKVEPL